MFLQPVLGYMHHYAFVKERRRTFWSYGHLWLGRLLITLGMINGGLGFLLALNTTTGPIVYGVFAGIFWVLYVASIFVGERRRMKKPIPIAPEPEKEESEIQVHE